MEAFIIFDDSTQARVLAEAKRIFEREGIPSETRVGDDASYGFVLVNMLGQHQSFRTEFIKKVRDANANGELPPDAAVFAEERAFGINGSKSLSRFVGAQRTTIEIRRVLKFC